MSEDINLKCCDCTRALCLTVAVLYIATKNINWKKIICVDVAQAQSVKTHMSGGGSLGGRITGRTRKITLATISAANLPRIKRNESISFDIAQCSIFIC